MIPFETLYGARLVIEVLAPAHLAGVHRFDKDSVSIGRGRTNDLILKVTIVSRRHVRISRGEDGRVICQDLGSACGFYVNGRRGGNAAVLWPTDRLVLGDVTLRCVAGLSADPAQTTHRDLSDDALIQRAIRGGPDHALADALTQRAIRAGADPVLGLLALATAPPSPSNWERLLIGSPSLLERASPSATQALRDTLDRHWPDALRVAYSSGWTASTPAWLARALRVSYLPGGSESALWSHARVAHVEGEGGWASLRRLSPRPLRALHLRGAPVGDDPSLLKPWLSDLEALSLTACALTEPGLHRLLALLPPGRLRDLALGQNDALSHDVLGALLDAPGTEAVTDWVLPHTMLPSGRALEVLERFAERGARLEISAAPHEARARKIERAERVFAFHLRPAHPVPITSGLRDMRAPLVVESRTRGRSVPMRFEVSPRPHLRFAGDEADLEGLPLEDAEIARDLQLYHDDALTLSTGARLSVTIDDDFRALWGEPAELPPTRGVFYEGRERFPGDDPVTAPALWIARRGAAPVGIALDDATRVRVGTDPTSELVLVSDGVAAHHALLTREDGAWRVTSRLETREQRMLERGATPPRESVEGSPARVGERILDARPRPRVLVDGVEVRRNPVTLPPDATLCIGRFLIRVAYEQA